MQLYQARKCDDLYTKAENSQTEDPLKVEFTGFFVHQT